MTKNIVCSENEEIEKVRNCLIKDEEIYQISDFFKIFGDSTRLKLLWTLDNKELCVNDLCEILNMTKSAISHQLKSLRVANLVKHKKIGKNVLYSLSDDHVKVIIETARVHLKEK